MLLQIKLLIHLIQYENITEIQSNQPLEIETIFIETGSLINLLLMNNISFSGNLKVMLNVVMITTNFIGLMHRLYGVGQFHAIKLEMIVYIILIGVTILCYMCIHLTFDNIRLDQLKSAQSNSQDHKMVEKIYESI